MKKMFENIEWNKQLLLEILHDDVSIDDFDIHIEVVEMYLQSLYRTKWIKGAMHGE